MSSSFVKLTIKSKAIKFISLILVLGILLDLLFPSTTQKLLANCERESHSDASPASEQGCKNQSVMVLHGLARSSRSMNKISQALNKSGYTVCNIQYPSRKYGIKRLATDFVYPQIKQCLDFHDQPLNFVTHSMGGIIVRQLAKSTDLKINHVVMLSPPNYGSELVDKLKNLPFFELINGQAGLSLGTGANSVPNTLGAVSFETGIIVGNKSFNPVYSYLIPGADDGKVAVENAKVVGMHDFSIVPYSHSFIMNKDAVIEQTINFIENGKFDSN